MDLLYTLPTSVSCNILCSWVKLPALVRLDSACCGAQSRTLILELLMAKEFVLSATVDLSSSRTVTWLVKRRVKVGKIIVGAAVDDHLESTFFRFTGHTIHSVEFTEESSATDARLCSVYCKSLKRIVSGGDEQMVHVRELLRSNPSVEELWFKSFTQEDNTLFAQDAFPHIKRLHIADSIDITSFPWLSFIGPALEGLEIVAAPWFSDADVHTITLHCPRLTRLGIRETGLSDEQLALFAARCPNIRLLDLAQCTMSDAGILAVAKRLPLQVIHINGCPNLTHVSLQHLRAHCSKKLVYFAADFTEANLEGVTALITACKSLEKVFFTDSPAGEADMSEVNNASIEKCCATMGNIKELLLEDRLVNDEFLCLVGKYCAELEVLDVTNTSPKLEKAQFALAEGCPKLRRVEIDSADYLGKSVLPFWQKMRPQLSVVLLDEYWKDGEEYTIFTEPLANIVLC